LRDAQTLDKRKAGPQNNEKETREIDAFFVIVSRFFQSPLSKYMLKRNCFAGWGVDGS